MFFEHKDTSIYNPPALLYILMSRHKQDIYTTNVLTPCVESEDAGGVVRSGLRPTLVGGAVCINQEGSGKAGGAPQILSGGTAIAIPTFHGLALNLHEKHSKAGGAAQISLPDKGKDRLTAQVLKGDAQKADGAAIPVHLWAHTFRSGYGQESCLNRHLKALGLTAQASVGN
jgi:hypothetical protein